MRDALRLLRGPFVRAVAVVLLGFYLGGCSMVVEPDVEELGAPPATCSPGTVVDCACIGGRVGTQRCTAGGSYARCQCGSAGAGG